MSDYNNNINNTMTDSDLVKINEDIEIKKVIHKAISDASEPLVTIIRAALPGLVFQGFGNSILMNDKVMDGLAVSISLKKSGAFAVLAVCSSLECPHKLVNDYRIKPSP